MIIEARQPGRRKFMSPVIGRSSEVPPRPGPPRPLPDVHVVPAPPLVPQVAIPHSARLATRWEYKHLTRAADTPALDEAELNALGTEGWELVGVLTGAAGAHFYFKREASR
jgi:hypothetical protein